MGREGGSLWAEWVGTVPRSAADAGWPRHHIATTVAARSDRTADPEGGRIGMDRRIKRQCKDLSRVGSKKPAGSLEPDCAELFVIHELGDGRILATDGAIRVAAGP